MRYQSEGPSALIEKQPINVDYAYKVQVDRDIEENHLTLAEASLKFNVCTTQIYKWRNIARTHGYDTLAIIRPSGRPPKKKKPEEMKRWNYYSYA